MNYEDKIKYLNRYKDTVSKIDNLMQKIDFLDHKAISVGSPTLSDMPKGGTPKTTEDIICEIMQYEELLKELETLALHYKRQTISKIDLLDDKETKELFMYYFIAFKTFDEIAVIQDCTTQTIKNRFKKGIEKIDI